jgi:hypothetical protein
MVSYVGYILQKMSEDGIMKNCGYVENSNFLTIDVRLSRVHWRRQ